MKTKPISMSSFVSFCEINFGEMWAYFIEIVTIKLLSEH